MRVTYRTVAPLGETVDVPATRIVTLVSWVFSPEWLTMKEASELSGHDLGTLHWMIQDGAVDTRREKDVWLIERASLREFQESLLEVLRWFE